MHGEFVAFVKERDEALSRAVLQDDWDGVRRYMIKWAVPCPDNETVLKVGVYKAVQQCRGIGEDVKRIAAEKCAAMGFSSDMYGVKGDE